MTLPSLNRRRVRLVENSIERVARMLAQQHGIRVVWRPGRCETNGRVIYLPTLPEDAPDALLEAVQGYLDHETAHILFTDFQAAKQRSPALTSEQFHCVNSIEDIRVEATISHMFPGSPYNLRKAHEWIYAQIANNWDKVNQFRKATSAYFDYVKNGESEFWSNTVDDFTKDLVKLCVEAVGDHGKLMSTEDAIDAGLRMFEVLKEFAPEEEKDRKDRAKSGNSETIVTSLGDIGEQLAKLSGELVRASISESGSVDLPNDLSYTHNLKSDDTYLIYSTEHDTYQVIDSMGHNNASRLSRLREEALPITGVLKMRLVNSLRATAQRRWQGGKEEGKVDSKRLHRAVLGLGNDVFKQRTDKVYINTAVVLAIDHSGSMHGRKLELAGESALAIGDVLHSLRVPFMVYGYSTDGYYSPKTTSPYARWNSLWIRFYREFEESWEQGALRLAGARFQAKDNTLDAESVKYGIRRLLLRPEKRKILLVFNDGMPFPGYGDVGRCQQHLKAVVESAPSVGVEVVAFGIQDDNVKEYYPNHVVIQNLDDLVKEPLKLLDSMLRKGVKLR